MQSEDSFGLAGRARSEGEVGQVVGGELISQNQRAWVSERDPFNAWRQRQPDDPHVFRQESGHGRRHFASSRHLEESANAGEASRGRPGPGKLE